LNKTQGACL